MKRKVALVVVVLYGLGVLSNVIIAGLNGDTVGAVAATLPTSISAVVAVQLVRSIRKGPARFMGWRALAASMLT
ncbi:MAG: hypothetical protein ACRDI2_24875, partial [Chloroflexota bacterium]